MALATIKSEYLGKRIGFNNSYAPLFKRDDIDQLAIMALESNNPNLMKLFEILPELSVLKKAKTEAELKRVVPAVEKVLPDKD